MNFFKKHNSKIKIFLLTLFVFLGSFRSVYAANFLDLFTDPGDFFDSVFETIGNAILWLSAQILAMAGILFNLSLEYTLNFKKLVEQTGMVDIGWTVIRDMGNMVFIFVILFLSIGTILGLSKYNIKNSLKNIILAALLINFSLFFTRVVIDTSNVIAVGFYNATIANTNPTGENLGFDPGLGRFDKGISGVFSQALNLHTIYDGEDLSKDNVTNDGDVSRNILAITIFGSLFLLITAFVFLTAAILLIVRVVYLMFLMMISPIAFIGLVLPGTRGQASRWWKTLFSQAFFAPIYLMFVYITATAVNSEAFKSTLLNAGNESFSSVFTGDGVGIVIFNFILLTGMMLASIIAAKSFGAAGANVATKYAGKAVGATSFGMMGRLGRKTIGSWAQKKADAWTKDPTKGNTWGSKMALKTLRNVGDRSFDARNTGVVKNTSSLTGVNLGDGIKGGYKAQREERRKSEMKYAQSLKGDSNIQAKDDQGNLVYEKDARGNNILTKPIMMSHSEVYGKKIQNKGTAATIFGKIWGTQAGDEAAAKQLVEIPKLNRELKELKLKLKKDNSTLKSLERQTNPSPTGIAVQQQVVLNTENKIDEVNEKIKKIKDSLKDDKK